MNLLLWTRDDRFTVLVDQQKEPALGHHYCIKLWFGFFRTSHCESLFRGEEAQARRELLFLAISENGISPSAFFAGSHTQFCKFTQFRSALPWTSLAPRRILPLWFEVICSDSWPSAADLHPSGRVLTSHFAAFRPRFMAPSSANSHTFPFTLGQFEVHHLFKLWSHFWELNSLTSSTSPSHFPNEIVHLKQWVIH